MKRNTSLPFTLSKPAISWIASRATEPPTLPHAAELLPVLVFMYSRRSFNCDGQLEESYQGEHFDMGWNQRDIVHSFPHVECVLNEVVFYVSEIAFEKHLKGRHLDLKTVEIGVPRPSSRTIQVLIARARKEAGKAKIGDKKGMNRKKKKNKGDAAQ